MRPSLVALTLVSLAGCRTGAPPPSDLGLATPTWTSSADLLEPKARGTEDPSAPGCATLKDSEAADVLKVTRGEDRLVLYANGQTGLLVVDVSRPDEPVVLASSPFVGTPIAVFEHRGAAIVVFSPGDRPASTVVRALALTGRTLGRPLGELELPGAPRDAWRVDDTIVVTRELPPVAGAPRARAWTAVTTFTIGNEGLREQRTIELSGGGAVTGASPWGVAVARAADEALGPDRTSVTWLGMTDGDGALHEDGTITFAGVVPRWRRATDHTIDVTEDGQVRVVACTTAGCTPGEPAAYAAIDFAEPLRPRLTSWATLERVGGGAVAFTANRLFVARPPVDGADATELAVFRTEQELVRLGAVRLDGNVASIVARDGDAIVLGWTGSASAGRRAVVHHVDTRRGPRRVGSASFGGDWTWSPAYDDERALSFDPNATVAALPMTTLRERTGAKTAVQVLSFTPSGPQPVLEREVGAAERVLFVDGRLLAFAADGVTVVTAPGEQRLRRSWAELR